MYLNCVEWRAVLLGNRWGRSTGHGPDARRSSERCWEVVDAFLLLYEFHYGRLVLHTHVPCRPTLVQALLQRPVVRVSCGYSHTGCIVAGGEVWGQHFRPLYCVLKISRNSTGVHVGLYDEWQVWVRSCCEHTGMLCIRAHAHYGRPWRSESEEVLIFSYIHTYIPYTN